MIHSTSYLRASFGYGTGVTCFLDLSQHLLNKININSHIPISLIEIATAFYIGSFNSISATVSVEYAFKFMGFSPKTSFCAGTVASIATTLATDFSTVGVARIATGLLGGYLGTIAGSGLSFFAKKSVGTACNFLKTTLSNEHHFKIS